MLGMVIESLRIGFKLIESFKFWLIKEVFWSLKSQVAEKSAIVQAFDLNGMH